jgi:cell division protein FtsQ
MDGGGRFARSLTRLRQGAWSGDRAASASRARINSSRLNDLPEPQGRGLIPFVATLRRKLPRHAGIAATCLVILSAATAGVILGDHLGPVGTAITDTRNAAANAAGFRIAKLTIAGRKQLTQDEVLAVGGITGRSSLLFLDAAAVRDKLKASPWIAEATVSKYYPDRLQIDITERSAFALWQEGGRVSVIAEDGAVLEAFVARRFTSLPLVVGEGAHTAAKDFLALLARFPQVRKEVKAAVMVGERRWNLRLVNGIDIRLPEQDADKALALLSQLERLPDRVAVRLSEDTAKVREELVKDRKNKRKAGDA